MRGHRIEPGEVEAGLERLDGVRAAVVSSMPGPDQRPRLVAHVALRGGAGHEGEASRWLAAALAEQVPEYMVPHRFVILDALPMTPNGKVDHTALGNPFDRRVSIPQTGEPEPRAPEVPSPEPPPVEEAPGVTSRPSSDLGGATPAAAPLTTAVPTSGPLAVLAELVAERPWPRVTLIEAGVSSLGVVRLANAVEDAGHSRPSFAELATRTPVDELAARWASSAEPSQIDAPSPSVLDPATGVVNAGDASSRGARSESGSADVCSRSSEVGGLIAHLRKVADRLERLDAELATVRSLLRDAMPGPALVSATLDPGPDSSAPPRTDHPLTEMQLAYLVGRAPDGHGATAAHYYTEALVEDLDVPRLQRALDTVVGRHPMLRAVITPDTHQRVLDRVDPRVEEVDLRGLDAAAQLAARDDIRAQRSHRVLPADQAPMLGLLAARLDGRWWRLHLDLDLLFCDAASALVVVDELARAYVDPAGLPPAPDAVFTDHVGQRADRSRAEAFWARRVPTLPPTPALGEVRGERRFVRRRLEVGPAGWHRLRASARAEGITDTCLVLDLVAEALRGDGLDDLTLVLTVADRPDGHHGVVGDYTGTVLVPTYAGPTAERRHRLQSDLLECLEHGMGPGGVHGNEVLRRLRETGRPATPTVVVSSALGEKGGDASQLLDVFGTTEYAISQTPGVLLDVQVFEVDGGLRINWDAVEAALPSGWLDERFARFAGSLGVGEDAAQAPMAAVGAVLAEVLGRDDLDPDTSFLDLGASSLMLVTAHRRLRERGHEIGVVDLFAHPTIRQVAARLAGAEPDGVAPDGRVIGNDALRAARERGSRRRRIAHRRR